MSDKSRTPVFEKAQKAFPILLLMLGWFGIGWFARGYFLFPADLDHALLAQARATIENKAIAPPPDSHQLTYAAVRGMLAALDDPYAAFREPPLAGRTNEEQAGDIALVGLSGEMQAGSFVVTALSPGGPAQKAGVAVGDRLLEIDGWAVRPDSDYMEVMTMIRGPQNSTAALKLERAGQPLSLNIARQPYQEVVTDTLAGGLDYLRFDQFTEKTPAAVEAALQDSLKRGAKGLVLDLRYNGGGLMDSTQAILDFFLPKGTAFYARTRDGGLIPYPTQDGGLAENLPLAVLISANTYSASETMAAALRDYQRAVLIGETTHGKGMIRETVPLVDGSSILLSVAEWLSPLGQENFEGRGVPPDLEVLSEPGAAVDLPLERAIEHLQRGT